MCESIPERSLGEHNALLGARQVFPRSAQSSAPPPPDAAASPATAHSLLLTRPISVSPSAPSPGVSLCCAPGGSFPCAIRHELKRAVPQKVPPSLCRASPPAGQAGTEHPPCHIPTCVTTQLHSPAQQLFLAGSSRRTAHNISPAAPAACSTQPRRAAPAAEKREQLSARRARLNSAKHLCFCPNLLRDRAPQLRQAARRRRESSTRRAPSARGLQGRKTA